MNQELIDLAVRRGALTVRIEMQRSALAAQLQPVARLAGGVDQALVGVDWLKRNPRVVAAAVALLVVLKPRRVWAWSRRAFMLWRGWSALKAKLPI